jgi:small subunit ribosomal protein S16
VAVKIKLKRLGKIRAPYYRIVVADSRTKRDGRAIEEIGKYHPKAEPSLIEVNSERAQHWLSVGAQPTDPVRKILEVTGDWQKFKGLPGVEGTLRTAEPKADKKVAFAAAVAESLQDSGAKTKAKSRTSDAKTGDARAGKAETADAKAGEGKAGRPARAKKPEPAASGAAKDTAASGAAKDTAASGETAPAASSGTNTGGATPTSAEAPAGDASLDAPEAAAPTPDAPAAAAPTPDAPAAQSPDAPTAEPTSPAAVEASDAEAAELKQEVEAGIAEAEATDAAGSSDEAEGSGA